jgi:hypothetical protein
MEGQVVVVLWYVVFVQFAVIVWLVYDKLKTVTRRHGGTSVDD